LLSDESHLPTGQLITIGRNINRLPLVAAASVKHLGLRFFSVSGEEPECSAGPLEQDIAFLARSYHVNGPLRSSQLGYCNGRLASKNREL
jgi:hypothetical protein